MVFFADAQMTIKAAIPSPVYQGAMNANDITLVAPVASDKAVVYARFILPNGIVSGMKVAGYPKKYTMTEVDGLPSLGITDESGTPYRAWTIVMDEPLTEYAGEATVQFFVTLGDITYASSSASFVINEGTPVFSDENIGLTDDLYNELLAAFGGFRAEAAASATSAADSATSAADSATSAASSAVSAASSAAVAEDSATAAALSEANASSSATAAALSEASAANSATVAADSAQSAADSAQAAADSAVASEVSASAAAQSAEEIAEKKVFALSAYYAEEAETARGYTKGGKTDKKFRELEERIGSGGAEVTTESVRATGALMEPSTGLSVGKYFKIAEIDESGHAVLEAVDAPSSETKIKFSGTEQTPDADGYVNIPYAKNDGETYGLVKGLYVYGVYAENGLLRLRFASESDMGKRSGIFPIQSGAIDTVVKLSMTDGKGAAWTDTERIAALLRMGCTVDENGFVKWTAQ